MSSFSACMLSCSVATVCCLAGVALNFTTDFCCSFSKILMNLVQLILSKKFMTPYPKNEGPNRLQPQSLNRPQFKFLALSHFLGAFSMFPCPSFLLPWALLFVLLLILPFQMKGPTPVTTLSLFVSLLERLQLFSATSWRGVMPQQQTIGLFPCYLPLTRMRPKCSTWNLLLHQIDAFACILPK
jgi:hypothetical protein